MAKSIATRWKVMVAGVNLSDHAFDVKVDDEKDRIDVSGFGAAREYLPGTRDQLVTIQFINDRASGSVHATIKPLYEGGSVFAFFVQPDSSAGTSATNELYGGSASVFKFPAGATLNEREEIEIEFAPSGTAGFVWGTVAP